MFQIFFKFVTNKTDSVQCKMTHFRAVIVESPRLQKSDSLQNQQSAVVDPRGRTLTGCWSRLRTETGRMGRVAEGVGRPPATRPHWSGTRRRRSRTPRSWTGSRSWSRKTPPAGRLGGVKRKTKNCEQEVSIRNQSLTFPFFFSAVTLSHTQCLRW